MRLHLCSSNPQRTVTLAAAHADQGIRVYTKAGGGFVRETGVNISLASLSQAVVEKKTGKINPRQHDPQILMLLCRNRYSGQGLG